MEDDTSGRLYGLLAKACSRCGPGAIALSGGLDSTILAYFLKGKKPKSVAVIASDFVATDLTYCQAVSKEFGIPLFINHASTADILSAVEETVRILGNFNDIEVRNSVVMYLAAKWAKGQDLQGIITGDGADELFAGYSFLLGKPRDELERELDRICSTMHFPAQRIGGRLGIGVESPFLDREVVEFAKGVPAGLKVREENGRTYGKWILRKTFERHIPRQVAWREKSPMQDGAGTAGLTGLFDSVISDDVFGQKKKLVQEEDGVIIRTKESMHYYEIYKKIHRLHARSGPGRACPYCRFGIGDSKFCRMCGAFPV